MESNLQRLPNKSLSLSNIILHDKGRKKVNHFIIETLTWAVVNPNRAGLLYVVWVGGWISQHLLDHPKTLWKTKKKIFDFLKLHYEFGKVTKFWTSKPMDKWTFEKCSGWFSPTPCPMRVNHKSGNKITITLSLN